MSNFNATYEKVPSSENTLLDDVNNHLYCKPSTWRDRWMQFTRHHGCCLMAINAAFFFISLSMLCLTIFAESSSTTKFVEKFSSYSPARSAVRYVSGTFNATQGAASPYVGTSNLTNEMWDYVTSSIGDQMITIEELRILGKPETSIKVTDPKTGREGYRIGIEVFHQLHCLNLVRKSTFGDFFKGEGDFAEKDQSKIRGHIDHCLEMLRMNIMCQVDIGVITFHELPGKTGDPYPDFSTNHVCRDFDAIRDWAIENTVANDDIF